MITKNTKVAKSKPNTVMKSSYEDFKVENFLTDILESDIDKSRLGDPDLAKEVKRLS